MNSVSGVSGASSPTVIDVGNCAPDHAAICRMLQSNFKATVHQAQNAKETLALLGQHHVDLILVNRKLDEDYSDGLEIIRMLKGSTQHCDVPCMLITNYEEYQQQAIQAGALRGFGKLSLNAPETLEGLKKLFGK